MGIPGGDQWNGENSDRAEQGSETNVLGSKVGTREARGRGLCFNKMSIKPRVIR